MKLKILLGFLLVFALMLNSVQAEKCNNCSCPKQYAPVCAKGKTYENACVAKCQGVVNAAPGACPEVCHGRKKQQVKKVRFCRRVAVKGQRRTTVKECCEYLRYCVGKAPCKNSPEVCKVQKDSKIKVTPRYKCTTKYHKKKGTSTKSCCSWTEVCKGSGKSKYCRSRHKDCKHRTTVVRWKGGCVLKENPKVKGKQNWCCKFKRTCTKNHQTGKTKCRKSPKDCRWKGQVTKCVKRRRCWFKTLNKYSKQENCCDFRRECTGRGKKRVCTSWRKENCSKGKRITRVFHDKCETTRNPKGCQQVRCCKWEVTYVNGVRKVKKVGKKCKWQGCARCTSNLPEKCKLSRKPGKPGRKQIRCVNQKVTRICNKKIFHKKVVDWRGPIYTTTWRNNCEDVVVRKTKNKVVTRRKCCRKARTCKPGKNGPRCRVKVVKPCSVSKTTKEVTIYRVKTTVKIGKYGYRKRLCIKVVTCYGGKNCSVRKRQNCRWTSRLVWKYKKRKCSWLKLSGNKNRSKRRCCRYLKVCWRRKKDKRRVCRKVGEKCRTGRLKVVTRRCACKWRSRKAPMKCKQRKCCCWKKTCYGSGSKRKCFLKKPKCKWTGYKITRHVRKSCNWAPSGRYSRKIRCCTHTRVCYHRKNGKKRCPKKRVCKWKKGTGVYRREYWVRVKKQVGRCKVTYNCLRVKHRFEGKPLKTYKGGCKEVGVRRCVYPRSKYVTRRVAKYTTQRWKCSWNLVCGGKRKNGNCRKVPRNGKCKPAGRWVFRRRLCNCSWKEGKRYRKRVCCCVTRRCVGRGRNRTCNQFNRKCRKVGSSIRLKWKHHCTWKPLSGGGRQLFCCKDLHECDLNGKGKRKCTKNQKRSKCQFRGEIITRRVSEKCTMKRWRHGKRQRCCTYVRRCFGRNGKKGKKKCNTVCAGCKWGKLTISTRKVKKCRTVFRGNCRKRRCCSYTITKINGKPQKSTPRCGWDRSTPKVCVTRHCTCNFRLRALGNKRTCRQNRCCCRKRRCVNGKCTWLNPACKWNGKQYSTRRVKDGCTWRSRRGGRQERCCTVQKKCSRSERGKTTCKRVKRSRRCAWKGPLYKTIEKRVCKLQHIVGTRHQQKQLCCTEVVQLRDGKVTSRSKKDCKLGKKVFFKGCRWRRYRICVRPKGQRTHLVCKLKPNPQFDNFLGNDYNVNKNGVVTVLKSDSLNVFARRAKWSNKFVNVAVLVEFGKTTVSTTNKVGTVKVGKTTVDLGVGKSYTAGNGSVKRVSASKLVVTNSKGESVTLNLFTKKLNKNIKKWYVPLFVNAVVKVKGAENSKGLCVKKNQANAGTPSVGF